MNIDQEFHDIAAVLMADEANELLERHLTRARDWLTKRRADKQPTSVADLAKRLHGEPNKRGIILTAYAAALWRLLESEGDQ